MKITQKEKQLTIQLLTEKLQRISGKKVTLKEGKPIEEAVDPDLEQYLVKYKDTSENLEESKKK